MNERIQELMVKAGIEIKSRRPYIDEEPDGYLESDNDFFLNNHDTIIRLLEEGGLEKFAKLIAKECATAIINDRRLNDVRSAANGCVRTINEHFGVEE